MIGCVRKRGSTWTYYFKVKLEGSYKQISKGGFRTKREAQANLTMAAADYYENGYQKASKETLGDMISYWLESVAKFKVRATTLELYESVVNFHVLPELGDTFLSELSVKQLQDFFKVRMETLGKDRLTIIKTVISQPLELAVTQGALKENPMKRVVVHGKKTPPKKLGVSLADVPTLEALITKHEKSAHYLLPFRIALYTGMRAGEVNGLLWEDVDFENKEIRISRQLQLVENVPTLVEVKTGASVRTNTMPSALYELLKAEWEKQARLRETFVGYNAHGYVCTQNGSPLAPNAFKKFFSYLGKRAGLDFSFHKLRHLHATIMLESGANPKSIQARLGHSSLDLTLNLYSHETKKMEKSALESLEKSFENG